jgi:hypothetical protein
MDAGPSDGPGRRPFGEAHNGRGRGSVMGRVFPVRVDEDVFVYGYHEREPSSS